MAEHMFPNFLSDAREYEQAERVWNNQWRQAVQQAGQSSDWDTPWLNPTFADGTLFRDGNPVFSAICRGRRIGIRVIQLDPAEAPGEFTYWYGAFAVGEPEELEELVIGCALSKKNLSKAMDLIRDWIVQKDNSQVLGMRRYLSPALTYLPEDSFGPELVAG